MSSKAIYESDGKNLLNKFLKCQHYVESKSVVVTEAEQLTSLSTNHPWTNGAVCFSCSRIEAAIKLLLNVAQKLVTKPDQLIKRRGKHGLVKANVGAADAASWVLERLDKAVKIGRATGKLKRFLVEPFVEHKPNDEHYVCMFSGRDADTIYYYRQGGVDIGDVDAKAARLVVPVETVPDAKAIEDTLLSTVEDDLRPVLTRFILGLYQVYVDLFFTYLEINPLVVVEKRCHVLDMAAKIDQCAEYLCADKWGGIEFPPPFGRDALPEEAYIADLDARTGASLKLTILNQYGSIWTMVAGGGASVIYADTICDLGGADELANYGEYSGAPNEEQTFQYAKTILTLMLRHPRKDNLGKSLIIGGGIANFTNVADTFKGIVRALTDFQTGLKEQNVSIFVRRGGPNFQQGLRVMDQLGKSIGVPIHVYGPETHMTDIVGMALGKKPIAPASASQSNTTANFLLSSSIQATHEADHRKSQESTETSMTDDGSAPSADSQSKECDRTASGKLRTLFTKQSKSIIWGMQPQAVQRMLDFDHVCSRQQPSVVAMIYPMTDNHRQKFYWGHKEILVPLYKRMDEAMKKHPEADVLISFASLRSAYESTMEALNYAGPEAPGGGQINTIAIIAEGIPENLTRRLIKVADKRGVTLIGPATVGALKPGCFKIGNTGGMLDNIVQSRLYRPGSVAYVSRSGGLR